MIDTLGSWVDNTGKWLGIAGAVITLLVIPAAAYFVSRRVVGDVHRQAAQGWKDLYEAESRKVIQHDDECREQIARVKETYDHQIKVLQERQKHTEDELAAHKAEGAKLREFNLTLQSHLAEMRAKREAVILPVPVEKLSDATRHRDVDHPPRIQT